MHRPDHPVRIGHALDQPAHGLGVLKRNVVTHRVGNIDRGRAHLDDFLEDPAQEIEFRATSVLGGELHVIGILAGPADGLDRLLDDLIRTHAQLLFHVDGRGRDERVYAPRFRRFDRLARPADVVFVGARQRTDGRLLDGVGNRLDGIEIAGRRRRESGLDDVHPHLLELPGDADLFLPGHRGAGTLLAIAQGGVEDYQMLFHFLLRSVKGPCA